MVEDDVRSILIVDDEVDACENLRDIFCDLGYHVAISRNGHEAIQQVARSAFDIVLLDLKMPGMDGVSVYRQIKRLRPETVAIVVSAFCGSELADRAVEEGAAEVVAKPVDVPQLLTAIEVSLAKPLVLIVDDDADFSQNLWQILGRRGYRLALAHSAADAREQLATKSFNVVLIDLRLPGGTGGEDVFRIVPHQSNPNTRRILITGFRDESLQTIEGLMREGVDAVCYKPIDVDNLLDLLAR